MIVRKRAEAAAEQSRSRLVEAQRIARVGSWENDLRSRVSVWSDEQFHILGYRPGEIEPHIDIFLARWHPDDAGRVLNALAAAAPSERFAVEYSGVHSDEPIPHLSTLAKVIHDKDAHHKNITDPPH